MSLRKVFLFVALLTLPALLLAGQGATGAKQPAVAAGAAQAEEGGAPRYIKPETPEQRMARLDTNGEDPGVNPDPEKIWTRKGGRKYKIVRFERRWAKYDTEAGYVRPLGMINFVDEIYQENDKYVWVWMEEVAPTSEEDREDAVASSKYFDIQKEGIEYLAKVRDDFSPLDPPQSKVTVRFEEASEGLPNGGSWRNSLAVADMNEDGFVDLVTPAQRAAGSNVPTILLGDGKGHWSVWKDYKWPSPINYGSVVAADFNKDKHMDLAFGLHLSGVAVYYGDGKGKFRESTNLKRDFPTRRILATDVDRDGWTDIVAISEGPMGRGRDLKGENYTNLRAFLNRNKGESWEGKNLAPERSLVSGDWLSAGNLNGDKYPDFVGSSIYFDGTHTIYLSKGPSEYERFDGKGTIIPFRSYYHANTIGKFSAKDRDDAIVASYRVWPAKLDPNVVAPPPLEEVVAIDRITFIGAEPKRVSIMRWKPDRSIWGMNNGDFNKDGNLDIIFTRHEPREAVILLGDGKGDFTRATVEGLTLPPLRNYDLNVSDVNADGRPDVILMYESESGSGLAKKNGRIQVFLNRGASAGK
ncbi:MAG TPA: VCBS repeat-containing protein [Thermoanaerobaculia bacterium]|nr:VCBS repeat-containing protein [Thermoanaerobaculia bacterium]